MNRTNNAAKSSDETTTEPEASKVITADEYLDAEELWKNHASKIITACVLIIVGVWFVKEYRTTQNQLLVDASSTYMQVKDNLLPILKSNTEVVTEDSSDSSKDLETFKKAIEELKADYSGTVYQIGGELSQVALSLSTENEGAVSELIGALSKSSGTDGYTLHTVAQEISLLLEGRSLISKDPSKGITVLSQLIDQGSILSPEAFSTLAVFETDADVWGSEGKLEYLKAKFEVIQDKNPRVANYIVRSLAQLGIFIDGISN